MKVEYSELHLLSAACWLALNNKKAHKNVAEAEKFIRERMMANAQKNAKFIVSGSKNWTTYTMCGGLTLIFSTDDEKTINVDISVSPAFPKNGNYDFRTIKIDEHVQTNVFKA